MLYNNVKFLCAKKKITVSALEKILGFGNGTIAKWENSSPTVDKVRAVADFFKVKIDTLVKGSVMK